MFQDRVALDWIQICSDMSSKARKRNIFNIKIASTMKYHKRLFYGIGVDTRELKDERGTKDHLGKDCRKTER